MSSSRLLLAVACVVLACASLTLAGPLTCNRILGVGLADQSFTTTGEGIANLVYFVGAFALPSNVSSSAQFSSFQFTYTLPDQSGYTTPNTVSFAVYADDGTGALVAYSKETTIKAGIVGDQTVVGQIQSIVGILQSSTNYRLGIWTANAYNTYINYNPSESTQYTDYNIAQYGWPTNYYLLEPGPYEPFQFPLTYDGCVVNPFVKLLGVGLADQSFTTQAQQSNNLVYIQGPYKPTGNVTATSDFMAKQFRYTVPDQTGYRTPNFLRFAVYNTSDGTLVAESTLAVIQAGVKGAQTFTPGIDGRTKTLRPTGATLRLAIWSEYPYLSYQNSLAPSNTLYTIYNASQGWPTNGDLLEAGPGPRFQFPLTYEGRT